MKRFKYLFILLFTLFIPKVYAFTYDIGTEVVSSSTTDKSMYDIRVSLKDIQGSDFGIASCTLNIMFNGDVKLNSSVRSLGSWTLTTGKFYLFDTGNGVHSNTEFFIIPVKIGGEGKVELIDIECFDDQTSVKINNKSINFKSVNNSDTDSITDNGNSNNTNSSNNSSSTDNNISNNNQEIKDSNCDLSDIILSEGDIQFESSVTDYYIEISDLDNLIVEPILVSEKADYTVDKIDDKIIINVVAEDGTEKKYTIFVEENTNQNNIADNENNKFVSIFIGIIFILVLINIFRIVRNRNLKD